MLGSLKTPFAGKRLLGRGCMKNFAEIKTGSELDNNMHVSGNQSPRKQIELRE